MSGTDIKKIKFLSVADNGVLQTFDTEYINVIGANISYLGNAITLDFQTPLSGYQPLNNNLNGLSSLSYSSGTPFIKMTGAGTFAFDTNTYLTGLTIGSTGIASGTSTRILYNNAGVLGEYAVTGTGTTAVLSTSPTISTSLTVTTASTTNVIRDLVGTPTSSALYLNQATPSATNYSLRGGSSNDTYINGGSGGVLVSINSSTLVAAFLSTSINFAPANAGAATAITPFTFTSPAGASQTASTEIPIFKVVGNTTTWAVGSITTQRWNYLSAHTAAFSSASTITNSYGLFVEAATAGTNATITNNYAAGFSGNIELTSSGTTKMKILSGSGVNTYIASEGAGSAFGSISAHNVVFYRGNSLKLTLQSSSFLFSDAYNIEFNATTGTKIGTAPSQKIGFWNATPIVQPTTAVVAATFVANTSAIANDTATFDGYTIGQIVKALRNAGLLA